MESKIKKVETWPEFMAELNKKNVILSPWCKRDECEKKIKSRSGEESKEQDVVEEG